MFAAREMFLLQSYADAMEDCRIVSRYVWSHLIVRFCRQKICFSLKEYGYVQYCVTCFNGAILPGPSSKFALLTASAVKAVGLY